MDQQQLELLWEYQTEDIKAEKIMSEIKNSPTRKKLEKDRDIILENQKLCKKIDEQAALRADRLPVIKEGISRFQEKIAALNKTVSENPPSTLEETQAFLKEANKCRANIADLEKELNTMIKEAKSADERRRSTVRRSVDMKAEFDKLKVVYEQETKDKKQELAEQRKRADEKKNGIDESLLNEYNAIKKHISQPLARLVAGRCSGCNTSLPSAVLSKVKSGSELVHCESCDRVLIP